MAGAAAAARRRTEPARNVSSTDTALEVLGARRQWNRHGVESEAQVISTLFNVLWVY